MSFNLAEIVRKPPSECTPAELDAVLAAERRGGICPGELPFHIEVQRQKSLDSPAYFATEIVDPYYKEHFEQIHYAAMDEVFAPYIIGETVRIEGQNFDPSQYLGLLVLFSRDTFKSSMMWLILLWTFLYTKLRLDYDTRAMYVHQVLKKAIKRGENIRQQARHNEKFREVFPEYRSPAGEWDTKEEWAWPNFAARGSGEASFTAYGETSDKTGGHYTLRAVDDWVTDESVGTPDQLEKSWGRFQGMDPLKDRSRKYNPYIIAGTNYHFQDTYKRMEANGGYLVWRVPAFAGSPKRLFDICSVDPRTDLGRRKIKAKLNSLVKDPPGKLYFPRRLDWNELYQNARAQGPHTFNCQMLLNPLPEGEQRFDREALDESWVEDIPGPDEMWCYIRIDPAISEKKKNDETAIVVGGVKWNAHRYIVDGWIGREKRPTEIVRKAFTLAKKWQAKGYIVKSIGVEAVQYQEALAQICRDGVPEREAKYDGESIPVMVKSCPVRSIHRSADMRKTERILEMDGPVTRRELKFWRKCGIAEKVMLQFKNFPFDRFDALDATHDLWEATMTPPKQMQESSPGLHKEMRKILNMQLKGQPRIVGGTNNTVKLTAWG